MTRQRGNATLAHHDGTQASYRHRIPNGEKLHSRPALVDLWRAVSGNDCQLHRPSGYWCAQADAAEGSGVVGDRLQQHRLLVSGGVCGRVFVRGAVDGSNRAADWIYAGDLSVEHRGDV